MQTTKDTKTIRRALDLMAANADAWLRGGRKGDANTATAKRAAALRALDDTDRRQVKAVHAASADYAALERIEGTTR
jgi:hypothetical protein